MNCGLGRSYNGISLYHPFGPFRPAFRPFRYAIMALIQRNMYDSVRALKDELFKLMAENEELKRRKKLDCFWGEKKKTRQPFTANESAYSFILYKANQICFSLLRESFYPN